MKIISITLTMMLLFYRLFLLAPFGMQTQSNKENEDGFELQVEEMEVSNEFSAYVGEESDRVPTRKILGMQDNQIYFAIGSQLLDAPAYPVLEALATYDNKERTISVIKEFPKDRYFLQDACIFQEELYYVLVDLETYTAELRSATGGDNALLKADAGTNVRCYPRLLIREGRLYFLYLNDLDENQAILNLTELLDQDEFRNIYERKVALPFSQRAESAVILESIANDGGDCLIVSCLYDREHNSSILLTYDGEDVEEITVENHVTSVHSSGSQILYTLHPEEIVVNNNVDAGFYSIQDNHFSDVFQFPQIADMKGLGNGRFLYHYRDDQNGKFVAVLAPGQEKTAEFENIAEVQQLAYFVKGERDDFLFIEEERSLSAGSLKIYAVQEVKKPSEGQRKN